jgi:catechol 2,3-dioxygenase-like lactoylglutathione lyase family enzyme
VTIKAIGHVGICVTDVDRSLDFYQNGLGFEVAWEWDFGAGAGVRSWRSKVCSSKARSSVVTPHSSSCSISRQPDQSGDDQHRGQPDGGQAGRGQPQKQGAAGCHPE